MFEIWLVVFFPTFSQKLINTWGQTCFLVWRCVKQQHEAILAQLLSIYGSDITILMPWAFRKWAKPNKSTNRGRVGGSWFTNLEPDLYTNSSNSYLNSRSFPSVETLRKTWVTPNVTYSELQAYLTCLCSAQISISCEASVELRTAGFDCHFIFYQTIYK